MKKKKSEIIKLLNKTLSPAQWALIAALTGKPIPASETRKCDFLNKLFHKKRGIRTAKGIARDLQQWTAYMISNFIGLNYGKDEPIQSREMGQSGPDVFLNHQARLLFPFTSECKAGERWSLLPAIKQAQANLYPGTTWMVVHERPHKIKEERVPPVITIDGHLFFKILHRAGELDGILKEIL